MREMLPKFLNNFVILLVIIGFVGAEFAASPVHSEGKIHYQIKASTPSGITFVLFEEAEKSGEEREKFIGVELADFSQVALFLSKIHTPSIHFPLCEQQFSIRPPLFTIHHAFLI